MSEQQSPKQSEEFDPFASGRVIRQHSRRARRERIVQEVMANRRGEYRVPTWVLALCLALMIGAVVAVLVIW